MKTMRVFYIINGLGLFQLKFLIYRSNSSVYVKLFIVAMLVTSMLVGLLWVEVNKMSWSCGFVDKNDVKHGWSEHFRVKNNVDKTYIE